MSTSNTEPVLPFPANPTPDTHTLVTATLWFVDHDGYRVVFCRHDPIYRIALNDLPHLRYVCVMLRQSELATQEELARAFGHSVASQRRWERRYQQFGLDGLVDQTSSGRPCKLDKAQEHFVRRWFLQGLPKALIARRLGVGEATVHRTCQRLGLQRPAAPVPELPLDIAGAPAPLPEPTASATFEAPLPPAPIHPLRPLTEAPCNPTDGAAPPGNASDCLAPAQPFASPPATADPTVSSPVQAETLALPVPPAIAQTPSLIASPSTENPSCPSLPEQPPAPFTLDSDPSNRQGDRFLARQGLLADAVPLFAPAEHLPRAGVLLAVPVLVKHGVLSIFEKVYGSLHPSFYGLRTLVLTLLVMALLRIKRPENLKEYAPDDLGRVLGLDRAPEVKTVRRKLAELAARQQGQQLMQALAQQRLAQQEEALAFLYIDGHVREYHGQEPLAKAKKPQSPVARTATTDYWVNDAVGCPLLVVSSEMNEALTQVLQPILEQVKALVPAEQRLTVLFDRGGFSPQLFRLLIDSGFDVITYRKGKRRPLAQSNFTEHTLEIGGRRLQYQLCDQAKVKVGRLRAARKKRRPGETPQFLWMRQVTVLRQDGGQTQVLTNRTDLAAAVVVYRLFARWRQENYFKYMEAEFALDALVEYGTEESSPEGDRPNPRRRAVEKRLRQARAEVERLQASLGEQAEANEESQRPTMRGFKIAHAELREQLQAAEARVARLEQKREKLPKRVPASDLKVLKKEKRYVVDAIKLTAYQIETELLEMLREHYPRTEDEGRTFLQSAFQSCGRLEVGTNELRVTLAAQSSPHRSRALAALCEKLNALDTCFPGTNLRLSLAVEAHEPLIP
jgi:Helix-turn-helix domain